MSDAADPKDKKIADLEKQVRNWRWLAWAMILFMGPTLLFILVTQITSIGVFKWAVQNEIDNAEYIKKMHQREIDELRRK